VRTDGGRVRRTVVVLGSVALLTAGVVLARVSAAQTDSGPRAGTAPLPSSLVGTQPGQLTPPAGVAGLSAGDRAASASASHSARPATRPGRPVAIDIPIRTPNHPNGVHAKITPHGLNPDRTLYIPADPKQVSWASADAMPGSSHGTAILTSHINYVINGQLVIGALSDLAIYARKSIGQPIRLHLADGRTLTYRIVAGREYTKEQLAAKPSLRKELYDQSKVYGSAAHPTGRLLLVSCGGPFDEFTGEYEDNVFLYALPVS
jgi:hypothetical protein